MNEIVKLRFKNSEKEYVAAMRAYMLHSPEILTRLVVASGLTALATLMLSMLSDAGMLSSLLWAGASFIGIVAMLFLLLFFNFPKRRFHAEPKFRDEYFLELSDEGIHMKTANIDSKINWSLYSKFIESEQFYLLVYGKYMISVIPKRAFTDARQESRFRELLGRNLMPQKQKRLPGRDETNRPENDYVPPAEPPDWR